MITQNCYIHEHNPDFPLLYTIHVLPVSLYKDWQSLDAFMNYKKPERHTPRKGHFFRYYDEEEIAETLDTKLRLSEYNIIIEIKTINHDSLIDFYNDIGYNPKTKKITSEIKNESII